MDQGPVYSPSEHGDDAPIQDPIMDLPPDPVKIDLVADIDTAEENAHLESEVDRSVDNNSHLYTKISISELCLLRDDANIGRKMRKKLTKKFSCSPLGQRFLGIVMMHVPKLALESAEKNIALFVSWFLADLDVPKLSPSATTLKDIMVEEAIDTVFVDWEEMKGLPLVLVCDKEN